MRFYSKEVGHAGLFCYELFCEWPEASLEKLAELAGIVDKEMLVGVAGLISARMKYVPGHGVPAN